MWLTSGRTIDHTSLSNFRRKHQAQLKGIYKQLVQTAIDMGVAKLSELCIDGTRVLADASRYKKLTQESLAKVLKQLDAQISEALRELDLTDQADDLFDDGQPSDKLPPELAELKTRREALDQVMAKLQEMDAARQGKGVDRKKGQAQIPKTDTDARVLPNKEGGYAPNYTPMAVTETSNGFIVGADVVVGNARRVSDSNAVAKKLSNAADCLSFSFTIVAKTRQAVNSPLNAKSIRTRRLGAKSVTMSMYRSVAVTESTCRLRILRLDIDAEATLARLPSPYSKQPWISAASCSADMRESESNGSGAAPHST